MSTSHTPGPVEHCTRGFPNPDVKSVSGRNVAVTWGLGRPKTAKAFDKRVEEDRANARRIVACWNACLDISTEELEARYAASLAKKQAAEPQVKATEPQPPLSTQYRRERVGEQMELIYKAFEGENTNDSPE